MMSFGSGIGDVLATLHVAKRIAEEVQNYRDAPQHFQHLSAELKLFQNTLQCVLQIQATDPHEFENLDRIRLISIHCQRPLQAFIDKMRSKETSLGHFRTSRTISTIGSRLHWSLITRKDVDDLRKVVVSEMVAINVLLGVQQLTYLQRLTKDDSTFKTDARKYFTDSKDLLTKSTSVLKNIEKLPFEIQNLRNMVINGFSRQDRSSSDTAEAVSTLTASTDLIISDSKTALERTQQVGDQVAKTCIAILSLTENLKRLIILLSAFSKQVLTRISANTRMLLDIQANMRRIIRAIEAIPLHLTLDIVRFDDALGESWALPFQACTEWQSFKDILMTVVFSNNRPGSVRVLLEHFMIMSATDNQVIQREMWRSKIKAGTHISQAMVVSKGKPTKAVCQLPVYNETQKKSRNFSCVFSHCLNCGHWSMEGTQSADVLQEVTGKSQLPPASINAIPQLPRYFGNSALPPLQHLEDDVRFFRRIYFHEPVKPIETLQEANDALHGDPENSRALQFKAWFHFPYRSSIIDSCDNLTLRLVVDLLERSAASDPLDSQTWYLLGRAYADLADLEASYRAYQRVVLLSGTSPGYWGSIGVLQYIRGQYSESLNAFTRSITLNPYIAEPWFGLGVVYDSLGKQPGDAQEAYTRHLELLENEGKSDKIVEDRVKTLHQMILDGARSSTNRPTMRDIDLRGDIIQKLGHQVDHQEDIRFAQLKL